jgi:hypothetical protein
MEKWEREHGEVDPKKWNFFYVQSLQEYTRHDKDCYMSRLTNNAMTISRLRAVPDVDLVSFIAAFVTSVIVGIIILVMRPGAPNVQFISHSTT